MFIHKNSREIRLDFAAETDVLKAQKNFVLRKTETEE